MRQAAAGIGTECHETRDRSGVYPVGPGPPAPAGGKALIRAGQLARGNAGGNKGRPQTPPLAAGCLKAHQRAGSLRQIDKARIRSDALANRNRLSSGRP